MVYTALICSSAITKYGKETNSLLTTKQGQKEVPLTMIEIVTSNQRHGRDHGPCHGLRFRVFVVLGLIKFCSIHSMLSVHNIFYIQLMVLNCPSHQNFLLFICLYGLLVPDV